MEKCSSYEIREYYHRDDLTNEIICKEVGRCYGTREMDFCSCGGDRTKCDFYPEVREKAKKKLQEQAKKEEVAATTIYYAHHQWKYYTEIEEYELNVIRRYFPHAKIFNPSTDLLSKDCGDEEIIMNECLETVCKSDILIFSCMNSMIGKGVYQEIAEAKAAGKLVLCISQNKLHTAFHVVNTPEFKNDRLYARVGIPMFE